MEKRGKNSESLLMAKQLRKQINDELSSASSSKRPDDLIFQRLSDSSFADDLVSVLASINAFEGLSVDRGLEGQLKAKVTGKVVTLDNMSNSRFYKKSTKNPVPPASRELLSRNQSKIKRVYEYEDPLTFSDLDDLASMWPAYASAFLHVIASVSSDDGPAGVPPSEYKHSLVCRKLELVGGTIKVSDSSNNQLIGLSGRIFKEGENTLHLIDERNKIRMIPKDVCTFTLVVTGDRSLTIHGKDILRKLVSR